MLTCMELHGNRAQQSALLRARHAGQGRSMRSMKGGGSLQRGCLQSSCCHQPSAQQLKHCLLHQDRCPAVALRRKMDCNSLISFEAEVTCKEWKRPSSGSR